MRGRAEVEKSLFASPIKVDDEVQFARRKSDSFANFKLFRKLSTRTICGKHRVVGSENIWNWKFESFESFRNCARQKLYSSVKFSACVLDPRRIWEKLSWWRSLSPTKLLFQNFSRFLRGENVSSGKFVPHKFYNRLNLCRQIAFRPLQPWKFFE